MDRLPFCRQRGVSLIELMISVALGLVVLAGVSFIFVSNSKSRQELERLNRQVENGRYAMQLLTEDLQTAGYLGPYIPSTTAPSLTSLPDPCSTNVATIDGALLLHIQGYDDPSSTTVSGLSCLSDVKTGTDILVVRRAGTCEAGAAGCDSFLAGAPHLQISGCSTDSSSYLLKTAQADLTLKKIGCTSTAGIRRFRTHIYFIANNNIGSDGVPTLKRAELGSSMTVVPLVDGIENLQLEYGLDTDNDGAPNLYTADPSAYGSCAGNACVQNWWNAMTVKVNLLARNTEGTAGYSDGKTYSLGLAADGSANDFGPYNDAYKRHAYAATVRLANAAGRRQ